MFTQLLQEFDARAVYANTLVLDEPIAAAKALNLPVVVHVREIPQFDAALCRTLGASAEEILKRVRSVADVVVANSRTLAAQVDFPNTVVVPNVVDIDRFATVHHRTVEQSASVNVSLISSNLPKKGVSDFIEVCKLAGDEVPGIHFNIIGPHSAYLDQLRRGLGNEGLPENLHFLGYLESPVCALENTDILLNLSHFQESFGRTVLESMAAGRPVIAYDWGALSELIDDGINGFLVEFKNTLAVADRVRQLAQDGELRQKMGRAGYKRALDGYSFSVMEEQLRIVLGKVGLT